MGTCMALVSGLAIPADGGLIIAWDPPALPIHHAEVVLGICIALVSGPSIPADGGLIIAWDPQALPIHHAEVVLGTCMALLSGFQELLMRQREVPYIIGGNALVEAGKREGGEAGEGKEHGGKEETAAHWRKPPREGNGRGFGLRCREALHFLHLLVFGNPGRGLLLASRPSVAQSDASL